MAFSRELARVLGLFTLDEVSPGLSQSLGPIKFTVYGVVINLFLKYSHLPFSFSFQDVI